MYGKFVGSSCHWVNRLTTGAFLLVGLASGRIVDAEPQACCSKYGCVGEMEAADCLDIEGTPLGSPGSTCETVLCVETGSCCTSSGCLSNATESSCSDAGGEFIGGGDCEDRDNNTIPDLCDPGTGTDPVDDCAPCDSGDVHCCDLGPTKEPIEWRKKLELGILTDRTKEIRRKILKKHVQKFVEVETLNQVIQAICARHKKLGIRLNVFIQSHGSPGQVHIGGHYTRKEVGPCTAPPASVGNDCTNNAQCDNPAGSGNGVCPAQYFDYTKGDVMSNNKGNVERANQEKFEKKVAGKIKHLTFSACCLAKGEKGKIFLGKLAAEIGADFVKGYTGIFQWGQRQQNGQVDNLAYTYGDKKKAVIPTVSEWGLVVLTLIGLAAGTILLRRRNADRQVTD